MEKEFNSSTCLSMQYELLSGMYFDAKEDREDYILCTSKVMDDRFWNLAYLKTKVDENIITKIEEKFKKLNRMPVIYIGVGDKNYEDNKSFVIKNGYKLNDTDVFMMLNEHENIDINMKVKVVETEDEYNDFMKVLSSAYNDNIESSEENVYADAVTKCYYEAIKNSLNSSKTYHIIGYNDENIPVSVATLNIVDGVGIINNVGTAQGYWNKGYSKQVLEYLINVFEENSGKNLLLCTEYKSKNQIYYEKLGFKEIYVMEQYIR